MIGSKRMAKAVIRDEVMAKASQALSRVLVLGTGDEKFTDCTLAFILTKGKRVRFERKRDVPLKRAMQLMQAARDKKGGDHNAGEKA